MAGRISSQGTKMFIQADDLAPGVAISAATKAKPAVVTVADAADFAAGKVVLPSGTTWRSLDNHPFQVAALATVDLTLHDSDTTDETNAFPASGAVLAPVDLVEFCMATLTFNSPAGTVIDVTTLCDDARETVSGLPAVSTWQATGFWDASDAVQERLRALYRSGEKVVFACVFNDGSGFTFLANVNSFDVRVGVDQAVAITVGGTMSGQISDLDPAVPLVAQLATPPATQAAQPAAQPAA